MGNFQYVAKIIILDKSSERIMMKRKWAQREFVIKTRASGKGVEKSENTPICSIVDRCNADLHRTSGDRREPAFSFLCGQVYFNTFYPK